MPFIDVRLSCPLNSDQVKKIGSGVTLAMGNIMGKRQEVTAVCIQQIGDANWTIGGKEPEQPTAYVDVKITAGTNTTEEKASLVAHLHVLLGDTVGGLAEASYIVVHELPRENWGYAGRTQAARMGRTSI